MTASSIGRGRFDRLAASSDEFRGGQADGVGEDVGGQRTEPSAGVNVLRGWPVEMTWNILNQPSCEAAAYGTFTQLTRSQGALPDRTRSASGGRWQVRILESDSPLLASHNGVGANGRSGLSEGWYVKVLGSREMGCVRVGGWQ